MLHGKKILLIVSGGIAAYKSLDLIRRLREHGAVISCVLTEAACKFITPLSITSLSGQKAYSDLFSLTDENEMGHIELSRQSDLILVAPATANILAKMASGICDDLATTVLMATNKPVMVAPSMNVRMWKHMAMISNTKKLRDRGIVFVGPETGDMACGEYGPGRMTEPLELVGAIYKHFDSNNPLEGKKALVTSGPTHEPIDPVRYISNRSSGKQGHAIAAALNQFGAETVLVTGPTNEPDPPGVKVKRVESAREMLDACRESLPVDIAVCAAAVTDWCPSEPCEQKIKKNGKAPAVQLTKNPDILRELAKGCSNRPHLVIGFAAETGDVVKKAIPKLEDKGCDWILANDVSRGTKTFGGDQNTIYFINGDLVEAWPEMTKINVGNLLAERIAKQFKEELKNG